MSAFANRVHLDPITGRSGKIRVSDGEYVQLSAYGLAPGVCVRVNQIHENPCRCEYDEKPFCVLGDQIGMDCNSTEAILPMPGCYMTYLCVDDCVDPHDALDFSLYAEVRKDLRNLQTVIQAACCGDR